MISVSIIVVKEDFGVKVNFAKCTFSQLEELTNEYLSSLVSPMDSFLEDHIIESEHFLIAIDDNKAGYFSIHNQELLTQFYINKDYRHLGQEIFFKVKKMQNIYYAFVSTSDEFFLSHALDEYKSMEKQAYFFKDLKVLSQKEKIDNSLSIKAAESSDIDDILKGSGDFFDNVNESILNEEIYIIRKEDSIAGFGIIEKGTLMKGYASIGMYTIEGFRRMGIGRNILLMLKEIVYKNHMKPIAGCWYYNHNSKKTLESAGMYSDTRLLKIHY